MIILNQQELEGYLKNGEIDSSYSFYLDKLKIFKRVSKKYRWVVITKYNGGVFYLKAHSKSAVLKELKQMEVHLEDEKDCTDSVIHTKKQKENKKIKRDTISKALENLSILILAFTFGALVGDSESFIVKSIFWIGVLFFAVSEILKCDEVSK